MVAKSRLLRRRWPTCPACSRYTGCCGSSPTRPENVANPSGLAGGHAEQAFRCTNVVPRFARPTLQSVLQERFALLALTDAHVPGADHCLARVILRINGQHFLVNCR